MKSRKLLEESGLRFTRARDMVLRFLYDVRRPLTHGQIAKGPGMENIDRITLYRTLAALLEAGLLQRVQGKDGVWHFCAPPHPNGAGCPGNHPHFLCTRCGQMRCLIGQSLPWITVDGAERVIGKYLVAYGLCSACATEQESGKQPALPGSASR